MTIQFTTTKGTRYVFEPTVRWSRLGADGSVVDSGPVWNTFSPQICQGYSVTFWTSRKEGKGIRVIETAPVASIHP